jgi:hypothetical protein
LTTIEIPPLWEAITFKQERCAREQYRVFRSAFGRPGPRVDAAMPADQLRAIARLDTNAELRARAAELALERDLAELVDPYLEQARRTALQARLRALAESRFPSLRTQGQPE